jgi:hypothetical protein
MGLAKLMFACCFLLGSTAAFAQSTCGENILVRQGRCFSAGCNDVFPMTTVVGCATKGCFQIGTFSTDCCGRTFYYSDFTGLDCPSFAELKAPEKRNELLALAATANVLVRDCKGSFVPLSTLLDMKRADGHAQAMN